MIPKYFLIAGGTGRQGGAVVNALLEDNATPIPAKHIFVLTRNVQGTSAAKLVERGVNLVQGDLSAPTAIFQHLKSLNIPLSETAAFLAQAHGPTELTDATAFIDATVENNLSYLVYSSVESRRQGEKRCRSLKLQNLFRTNSGSKSTLSLSYPSKPILGSLF